MNENTIKAALEVLDTQEGYIRRKIDSKGRLQLVNTVENQRQDAYYHGMKVMLELILTEDYTKTGCIVKGIYNHRFDNSTNIPFESKEVSA